MLIASRDELLANGGDQARDVSAAEAGGEVVAGCGGEQSVAAEGETVSAPAGAR